MTDTDLTSRLFDDAFAGAIDPLAAFDDWLDEANRTEPSDANAMVLATVDADGLPDTRIVLLKARDDAGFTFYTNLESAKALELAAAPRAALNFYWKSLSRQIRLRGPVARVPDTVADAYFASRPRGSQIGAHASAQSRPLASRAELLARVADIEARYEGAPVPRPAQWSGFTLTPLAVEFWQAGEFRLHDRVVFSRPDAAARWSRRRLNP